MRRVQVNAVVRLQRQPWREVGQIPLLLLAPDYGLCHAAHPKGHALALGIVGALPKHETRLPVAQLFAVGTLHLGGDVVAPQCVAPYCPCLLYTSDAADDVIDV